MLKRVPGTKDILPQEVSSWQKIEAIARNTFFRHNYQEIRPPLIEEEALFNRSLGETAEIIQKQMFLIKSGRDVYALRPEGTASIVRAYLENNLDKKYGFMKLYYIGPMFRLERPQKGRLRQFHHLGCEALGSQDPGVDVEAISLADNLLKAFKIDKFQIKLNSLGCSIDKRRLSEVLKGRLEAKAGCLCEDCQRRLSTNVLRILDCKNERCQELVRQLDLKDRHLCPECKAHFLQVREGLDILKIDYQLDPYLVRGLDYYTRTVFEIRHSALGSQDALGAGGRYDNLIKQLGGPDIGAIGFALGMERLFLVSGLENEQARKDFVFVITLGKEARREGLRLLYRLRNSGICADTCYENKSLKGAMRQAHSLGATHVLMIGENELKKGTLILKDMVSGGQKELDMEKLLREFKC